MVDKSQRFSERRRKNIESLKRFKVSKVSKVSKKKKSKFPTFKRVKKKSFKKKVWDRDAAIRRLITGSSKVRPVRSERVSVPEVRNTLTGESLESFRKRRFI